MRITDVTFHKINIPLEAPLIWSGGSMAWWTRIIVRMQTDEGIEGIGETTGSDATMALLHHYKSFFVGEDPADLELIRKNFWYVPLYEGFSGQWAIAALETCCWDILGKAADRPLCQLIGGKVRSRIPVSGYVFPRQMNADGVGGERTPEQLVEQARSQVAEYGVKTIKLKGGSAPPEEDLTTLEALRDTFPHHKLRFDPNSIWTVENVIRAAPRLEALNLEWCEDLVWGFEAMSRARSQARLVFSTNMCSVQLDHMPMALGMKTIDVQLMDPIDLGGLTATMKVAATCQAYQLGTSLHSAGESSLGAALMLHVAAALPSLPYAMDTHAHYQTDDVTTEPFRVVDGFIDLPTGPGLGVSIDEDRLAFLARHNAENGDSLVYGDMDDRHEPRFPGMW